MRQRYLGSLQYFQGPSHQNDMMSLTSLTMAES